METIVFDRCIVMKDEAGIPGVFETLDKLDKMLDEYKIKHSFALPHNSDIEKEPRSTVTLYYGENDDMAISLVYALFCKVYRGVDDKRLGDALVKIASHYISDKGAVVAAL